MTGCWCLKFNFDILSHDFLFVKWNASTIHIDKRVECFVIYILSHCWQSRLNEYETMLSNSPKDATALEVSQECLFCSALFCISENIWKKYPGSCSDFGRTRGVCKSCLSTWGFNQGLLLFWPLISHEFFYMCINYAVQRTLELIAMV